MDNYILRGKRVLARDVKKEKTDSGLVIAAEEELTQLGEVIQSNVEDIPKGAKIIYNKFVPQEIEQDGEKYIVLEDDEVLMVEKK